MAQALTPTETTATRAIGLEQVWRPRSVFASVPELQAYRMRWNTRVRWYEVLRSYYRGTFYSDWPQLRELLKLYSGIRQIFGPLRRAVRVDVAKVPGGWLMPEEASPTLVDAVEQVRAWSLARVGYSRAVLHGAVAGEFALLAYADEEAGEVQVLPLRPDEVILGELANDEPFGLIIKPNLAGRGGRYEYSQLITRDWIQVRRDGQIEQEYRNRFGFIPLLLSPYLSGEDGIGENSFAGTQELLDRVNDAASQALDVVQRNAEPLTVFSGVDNVDFDPGNNALVMARPEAKAYTLTPNLAIEQATALIDKVLGEFKNQLPQLILDDLRSRNDLAYDTVVTLLMELTDHVNAVRANVDTAVETAERWALQMGLEMGLFGGINPDEHRLDPERPVIQPTEAQRLALEAQRYGVQGAAAALEAQQTMEGRGRLARVDADDDRTDNDDEPGA